MLRGNSLVQRSTLPELVSLMSELPGGGVNLPGRNLNQSRTHMVGARKPPQRVAQDAVRICRLLMP